MERCGRGAEWAGDYMLDVVGLEVWFFVAMVGDVCCGFFVVLLSDYIAALQPRAIAVWKYLVD